MFKHRLYATMALYKYDSRPLAGKRSRMTGVYGCQIVAAALIAATVAGCEKASPPISEARPVRTVTVERGAEGEIVSLTGQISREGRGQPRFSR